MSTIVIFFYRFIKYKTLFILVFLFKFNIASSQINDIYNQYIIQHFNTDNGLPTNQVWHSCVGADGRIYIATDDGVVIYDGIFFKQLGLKDGMKSQSVYAIFPIFDRVITHSFKGSNIIKELTINKELSESIPNFSVSNIFFDGFYIDSNFIHINYDSMFVLNHNFKLVFRGIFGKHKFKELESLEFAIKPIYKNNTYRFYLTKNGFLGLDLMKNLNSYRIYKNRINRYVVEKHNLEKAKWVGYDDSNIYYLRDELVYKKNYFTSKKTNLFKINQVNSMTIGKKDLYICNRNGFYILSHKKIFKRDSFSFRDKMKDKLNKLNSNLKYYLIEKSKKIWICTGSGILVFKNNKLDTTLIQNRRITAIIQSKNGNKWVSTYEGIYRIDSNYKTYLYRTKNFGNAKINSIVFESDSILWISSEGNGIFKYHLNHNVIKPVKLGNFQITNNFHKIYIDPRNRKWLLSENGIIVIDGDRKKIMRKQEGLLSNRAVHLYFKGDTTYIYYEKGRDIFKYDSILTKEKIPLVFNEFKVSGKKYDSLPSVLSPDQNKISIQMVGIFFPSPKDIIYRYRLERNENLSEWRWYNSNDLNFDELNYGKYSLQIQAINKFNPFIHSEIKKFQFEIEPFWYQRPIVWILISILLVSIVVLVLFQSYKKRQNRIIRKLATESKLNLYRLNGLQNQMNPHFVFNSLNTLQYLIASKEEEKTNQYLTDFSLLMREMLDQSRHLEISLEDEIRFLKKYISLEKIRFSDTFDCKWTNSIAEEEWSEIFIPNMLIQPLIENAIKYGIPNSKEDAKFIEIKMDLLEANILEVKIIDHGKWIERASLSGKAHSLMITKERVGLYEKDGVKGNLVILKNSTGSEVKLNIPI
jgi:predicted SAM-dependent methyltransferase